MDLIQTNYLAINLWVKKKVLEEINELIEAVENNSNKIHETADVLYHLIMYLEVHEIKIEDVCKELDKRKKWLNYVQLY